MNGAVVNTCANPAPMSGWTAADFIDCAKRLREQEGLSLADDWAEQLEIAAQLINAHAVLVKALQLIERQAAAEGPACNLIREYASAALAKVGAK